MKRHSKTFLKLILTAFIISLFVTLSAFGASAIKCDCHGHNNGWVLDYDLFDHYYFLRPCEGYYVDIQDCSDENGYIYEKKEYIKLHDPISGSVTPPTTYDIYRCYTSGCKYQETVPVEYVVINDVYSEKAGIDSKITSITSQIETVSFGNCSELTAVTLLEGVKNVNMGDCTSPLTIYFPSTIENVDYGKNNSYNGTVNIVNAVFAPGTKTIPSGSLGSCKNLKNVTIPDSVTTISDRAFGWCESLESIALPSGLEVLGDSSFASCTALKNITIPDSVTEIGLAAFSNCTQLEKVTLKCTSLSRSMFRGCVNLKTVTLPEGIETICGYSFERSGLEKINIPSTVKTIEDCAFLNTKLESIQIPVSVTEIGEYALYSDSLKDIYYEGSKAEWSAISKHYTAYKFGTTIHYNSSSECTCNCHKTGIMGIIWRIVLIIQKLFGLNPVCACGAAHY